jgi:hypothetical protein
MHSFASDRNTARTFPPTFLASPFLSLTATQILPPMLLVVLMLGVLHDPASSSAASNSQTSTLSRPCSSNPGLPSHSKPADGSPKINSRETPALPPACIEVKAAPLELQDFLQAFIRSQKWRVGQQQSSPEGLSFFRYLDADELARFAHTEILGGRMVWTEGKVAVQISTTEATDGFTHVQINAKFQGKGSGRDQFARPTGLWPLVSRGTLEGSMIAALESRADSSRR